MKKIALPIIVSMSMLGAGNLAHAEQKGKSAGLDERVQVFDYSEHDVFRIHTKVGVSTLVQFEQGEIIPDDGGLGMGEAKNWSLAVKANNIFFKPTDMMADTNMIVVTNKRTYAFELATTTGQDVTYVARFKYPEEPQATSSSTSLLAQPKVLKQLKDKDGKTLLVDSRINTNYYKKGTSSIAPTAVWDNNLFTYMQFDNANELPAVYRILPDGSEQVVNSHIEKDTLVLHEVNHRYRLRLGQAVMDIKNLSKTPSTFNETGTSQDDVVRGDQ